MCSKLAQEKNGCLWYDTHEHAVDQYAADKAWRRWTQPLVKAVEAGYIEQANIVSCVSDGIAQSLKKRYRLIETPLTLRNIPRYERSLERHQTTNPREVLYQGVIMRGRGLEALIEGVSASKSNLRLIFRGPHFDAKYFAELKMAGQKILGPDNFDIQAPINPKTLIKAASKSDIGVMLLGQKTEHNRLALPNKVFEYIMAGLPLVVSNNPDMASIVKRFGAGAVVSSLKPDAIAKALDGLQGETWLKAHKACLRASETLNWEAEKHLLLDTANSLWEDRMMS